MKQIITVLATGLVTLSLSTSAFAKTWTSSKYKELRSRLRDQITTDYQAERACDEIRGDRVDFESKVFSISRSGMIEADMDDDLFSYNDIKLYLNDSDEALGVKQFSHIQYVGMISGCKFSRGSGSLELTITDGQLKLHY